MLKQSLTYAMMFFTTALLLSLARASDVEAMCAGGEHCASGEQEETGMLQQTSRVAQIKRHESLKVAYLPNTTADCYKVPNINTGLTIEYDSTCPGLGCFENYPCRYVDSAAALAQVEMLQSAKHDIDDCYCKEPNGNNNEIWCRTDFPAYELHGNCPLCCQCTSVTMFSIDDIAAQCHGGSQCGKCGT